MFSPAAPAGDQVDDVQVSTGHRWHEPAHRYSRLTLSKILSNKLKIIRTGWPLATVASTGIYINQTRFWLYLKMFRIGF